MLRFYETLTGRGQVYDGDQLLAEAEYRLKDVEEVVYTPALPRGERAEAVPGQRSIYGLIKSPQVQELSGYVGAKLALRLQDGRLLPFTVSKVQRTGVRLTALLIRSLGAPR